MEWASSLLASLSLDHFWGQAPVLRAISIRKLSNLKASHRDKIGAWEIQQLTEHTKEVGILSLKKKKMSLLDVWSKEGEGEERYLKVMAILLIELLC